MKIHIQREQLLTPLQYIIGVVERRQIKPILSHVLVKSNERSFSLTATDLKTEIVAHISQPVEDPENITLPARKLLDICKSLPEGVELEIYYANNKAMLRSVRSRFTLSTLPSAEFPTLEELTDSQTFNLRQSELKTLIERTSFAMAQQDVRYYLNGLLLDVKENNIISVATDGHRLGIFNLAKSTNVEGEKQVIIPRKGVLELLRLLEAKDEITEIHLTPNHIRVNLNNLQFTSKVLDARFPDYTRVIPTGLNKILLVDCDAFQQALSRVSILSNEKYRGIRLTMQNNVLKIQAHNPEQEEAEEQLEVSYTGEKIEIGFNVNYLLDVLSVTDFPTIEMHLKDENSSVLFTAPESNEAQYVVMPMRL